jgi:hypothetical protein
VDGLHALGRGRRSAREKLARPAGQRSRQVKHGTGRTASPPPPAGDQSSSPPSASTSSA